MALPYCPECGKEIQRGVKFCPECGAQLGIAATSAVARAKVEPKAPGAGTVSAYAALDMVFGLLLITLGVLSLLPQTISVSASVRVTALLIFLGGGVLAFVSGYGVFRRRTWTRIPLTITGFALILVGIILAFAGSLLAVLGLIGFVLGVASLALPRLRQTRVFFGT